VDVVGAVTDGERRAASVAVHRRSSMLGGVAGLLRPVTGDGGNLPDTR
jgi:hypothetical protein